MDTGTGPDLPVPQNLLDLINNSAAGFCPEIKGPCRIDCIARAHAEYEGFVDSKEQFMGPGCRRYNTNLPVHLPDEVSKLVRIR